MKNERILITGGTGKIGARISKYFAKNGWDILITSSNEKKASKFVKNFTDEENIDYIIVDHLKDDASKNLIKEISRKGYVVNHLINNVRSLESLKVGKDGFSKRIDLVNEYILDVIVPYELSVEIYKKQKGSLKTIINIGSQYGSVAMNPSLYNDLSGTPIQYGLAKSALHHLTKELSVRFIKDDVRVNCVAYGGLAGRVDEEFIKKYSKLVPSGRMLEENEVIGPIEFLLSDKSSSINGEIIAADGGWTSW